jgi:hypothetical protein
MLREIKMASIKKAPDGTYCLFKRLSKERQRFIFLGKERLDLNTIRIPNELKGKRFKIFIKPI